MNTSILSGIQVLDLSRFIAGPLCCQMLGDMGADVIEIETIEGEAIRHNRPLERDGRSVYSNIFNRNKRGLSLDPRSETGRDILQDLASRADLIVENFRPGVIDKMGLGFEDLQKLNPRASLISISGFGQSGGNRDRALFDAIAQAETGLMSLTGNADGAPSVSGSFVVDHIAAYHAVMAAMAALRVRDEHGNGQHVDVAAFDAMYTSMGIRGVWAAFSDDVPSRNGARDVLSSPTDAYRCSDGYMYIQAGTNSLFPKFAAVIGAPELAWDVRYRDTADRVNNVEALTRAIEEWTSARTCDEVGAELRAAGIPHGTVNTPAQAARSTQVIDRELLRTIEHPVSGPLTVYGHAMRFSSTPLSINLAPPLVGEHTREILTNTLGWSDESISRALKEKTIGSPPRQSDQDCAAEVSQ